MANTAYSTKVALVDVYRAAHINAVQDGIAQLAINVKAPLYSAKGDGATDDTLVIQQAIDDVYAAGGGYVYMPPGTYIVTEHSRSEPVAGVANYVLIARANVRLVGAGMNATILKLKNSSSPRDSVIEGMYQSDNHDVFMGFRDFTIDGNKANQSNNAGGIRLFSSPHCLVERVEVRDIKSSGEGPGFNTGNTEGDVTFVNCISSGIDGSGFQMNAGSTRTVLIGCRGYSNTWMGFAENNAHQTMYLGCTAWGNTKYGFNNEVADGSTYNGCISELNTIYGWSIGAGAEVIMNGCIARKNNSEGILLVDQVHSVIVGNMSYDDQGAYATQTYGIRETGTSKENTIRDNHCFGNVTLDYDLLSNGATAADTVDIGTYVPFRAGAPSSTPLAMSQHVPIAVDTTNNKLYAYYGGSWHSLSP